MAWTTSGTISLTNGSAVVYGSGTTWASDGITSPGDTLLIGTALYQVLSIQADTQLTLASNYLGTTASSQAYSIIHTGLLPSALASNLAALQSKYLTTVSQLYTWETQTSGTVPLTNPATGVTANVTPLIAFMNGIPNASLVNSSFTIGSTVATLGATVATIAGLTLTSPTIATPTFTGTTTAAAINASGNVAITGTLSASGKISSTATSGPVFGASNATTGYLYTALQNTSGLALFAVEGSTASTIASGTTAYATVVGSDTATPLQLITNNTVRATLNSSGNLGLGVTPSAWATGSTGIDVGSYGGIQSTAAGNFLLLGNAANTSSGSLYKNTGAASAYGLSSGAHQWSIAPSGTAGNTISFTQAMTLDNSGNLMVGQTSAGYANANSLSINGPSGYIIANHLSGTASGAVYAAYAYNATAIGSITQSGTTAVLYNTTSDQRLKTDLGMVTTTDVIANTVIHDYAWTSDGTRARGVFAQEAVTVNPAAVKVGDDGPLVEDPWQVDYSKYVPDLIVTCQMQARLIEQLSQRLAALESKA